MLVDVVRELLAARSVSLETSSSNRSALSNVVSVERIKNTSNGPVVALELLARFSTV